MSFRLPLAAIASAIVLVSGSALASDPQTDKADKPVLRGPDVKEGAAPGGAGSFGGQKQGKFAERPLPHQFFVRAFGVLRQDSTPADARLTDGQEASLREINAGFVKEQSEFFQKNRAEAAKFSEALGVTPPKEQNERATRRWMEQLRAAAAPRPGKKADAKKGEKPEEKPDDMQMMDQDQAARTEAVAGLKAIMERAPKAEDTHAKMWAVLTEAQKPLVQQELDNLRKADRKDVRPAGGESERPMALLPEQMRERLKNLPPEEREKIAAKMRAMPPEMRERIRAMDPEQRRTAIARYLRSDASGQPAAGERRKQDRPARKQTDKQAPPMDDVNVPSSTGNPK
jgi:hypothetical protein